MGERENDSGLPDLLEGRFEVQSQLGRGASGVVYQAFDRERDTQVALKALRCAGPSEVLRFKSEFRALRDLRHPNLVELGELFESAGTWFFTMELLEGVDFLDYVRGVPATGAKKPETVVERNATVKTTSAFPALRATPDVGVPRAPRPQCDELRLRHAVAGLAKGLAALHGEGKVHRDVKPSNIIITESNRVVLLDFGVVADLTTSRAFEKNLVVGTVSYMAPEQISGGDVGPEADWYALGVLMFVSLTGQRPFGGNSEDVLARKQRLQAPNASQLANGISSDLDQLCAQLLSRRPGDRPTEGAIFVTLGIDRSSQLIKWPANTPFVGRREELAALKKAFEDSRNHAVCVFVEGESGIGKSSTVDRFVEVQRVDEPNLVVLRGRCHERERVAYNAFDGIVDDLVRHLLGRGNSKVDSVVPDNVAALLQVFPTLRAIPEFADRALVSPRLSPDDRGAAFVALRQLLTSVANTRRLLLVIDDAQWADADSSALLEEILADPDSASLCLVATRRTGDGAQLSPTVEAVTDHFRRIPLGGLNLKESEELVRLLVQRAPGGALRNTSEITAEAGAHPMFLRELIQHATDRADSTSALRLDDAIWARAQRLDPPARALLHAICVAGAPITQSAALAAAQCPTRDSAVHVSALQAGSFARVAGARVQDEIEPYHDRVREAVYSNLPLERRRELHETIAMALEREGAAPESLFRHYESAGSAEQADHFAAAAARAAFDAMAFERAAELFRRALEGVSDAARRSEVLEGLGRSLASAGRAAEAGEVFLEGAEFATDPSRKLDLQRRAAERFLMSGHQQRGRETSLAVLRSVGMSLPSSSVRIVAGILWNQLRLRSHSLKWKRRKLSTARTLKADVCWSMSAGFSMVDPLLGTYFGSKALLLALNHGTTAQIARSLGIGALSAGLMNRRAQSERLLRAAEQAVDEDGTPHTSAYLAHLRMMMQFVLANDWNGCLEKTRELETILSAAGLGLGWEADVNTHFACASLQLLGQYGELAGRVRRGVQRAQRTGNLLLEVSLRVRFCARFIVRGRCDLAREDLDDALAAWLPESDSFGNQRTWALLSQTRIALCAGDLEKHRLELEANWRVMHRSLVGRVKLMRTEWYHTYGTFLLGQAIAAKRRGEHSVHRRLCNKALSYAEALSRSPYPSARHTEWLLRAGVSWARDDRGQALADTRRALEESVACKSFPFQLCIRRRLGELVGGSEGDALIADAEADAVRAGVTALRMFCEAAIPTGDPR